MKNLIFFLLILTFLFTGCSKTKIIHPAITFGDTAYIKIIAESAIDSLVVRVNYSNLFPIQPCLVQQKTITKKGICKIGYSITKPEIVEICIQDTFMTYIIPADTLVIKVGIDTTGMDRDSIYYKIEDPVYAYFKDEKEKFGCYYFQSPIAMKYYNSIPKTIKAYERAVQSIDSAQNERLAFLENRKKDLPKWFVSTHQANYIYYSARMKFYQYFYLHDYNLEAKLPPINVSINNPDAMLSMFYWGFLSDYFLLSDTVDNHLAGTSRIIALYNKAYPKINTMLKGDVLRIFNTYFLLDLNVPSESLEDIAMAEQFFMNHDFKLNKSEITYINQQRSVRQKYLESVNKLLPGENAPAFYLKDVSGKFRKLSEFKGEIVYLHFWATWCGPCIKELPSINQLYEKIGNRSITIINICTDRKVEKWKQIVEKENLKGINVICQGNWANELQKGYSIKGVPHYVMIDKNGIIIENSCKRPNEIYDDLILAVNAD